VAQVVVVHRVGHTLEVVVGASGDPETPYREQRVVPEWMAKNDERTMDRDHPDRRHLRRHLPSSWVGLHRNGARRHPRGTPTPAVTWPDPHSAGRNRPKGGRITQCRRVDSMSRSGGAAGVTLHRRSRRARSPDRRLVMEELPMRSRSRSTAECGMSVGDYNLVDPAAHTIAANLVKWRPIAALQLPEFQTSRRTS
jgi:hypothetical protein